MYINYKVHSFIMIYNQDSETAMLKQVLKQQQQQYLRSKEIMETKLLQFKVDQQSQMHQLQKVFQDTLIKTCQANNISIHIPWEQFDVLQQSREINLQNQSLLKHQQDLLELLSTERSHNIQLRSQLINQQTDRHMQLSSSFITQEQDYNTEIILTIIHLTQKIADLESLLLNTQNSLNQSHLQIYLQKDKIIKQQSQINLLKADLECQLNSASIYQKEAIKCTVKQSTSQEFYEKQNLEFQNTIEKCQNEILELSNYCSEQRALLINNEATAKKHIEYELKVYESQQVGKLQNLLVELQRQANIATKRYMATQNILMHKEDLNVEMRLQIIRYLNSKECIVQQCKQEAGQQLDGYISHLRDQIAFLEDKTQKYELTNQNLQVQLDLVQKSNFTLNNQNKTLSQISQNNEKNQNSQIMSLTCLQEFNKVLSKKLEMKSIENGNMEKELNEIKGQQESVKSNLNTQLRNATLLLDVYKMLYLQLKFNSIDPDFNQYVQKQLRKLRTQNQQQSITLLPNQMKDHVRTVEAYYYKTIEDKRYFREAIKAWDQGDGNETQNKQLIQFEYEENVNEQNEKSGYLQRIQSKEKLNQQLQSNLKKTVFTTPFNQQEYKQIVISRNEEQNKVQVYRQSGKVDMLYTSIYYSELRYIPKYDQSTDTGITTREVGEGTVLSISNQSVQHNVFNINCKNIQVDTMAHLHQVTQNQMNQLTKIQALLQNTEQINHLNEKQLVEPKLIDNQEQINPYISTNTMKTKQKTKQNQIKKLIKKEQRQVVHETLKSNQPEQEQQEIIHSKPIQTKNKKQKLIQQNQLNQFTEDQPEQQQMQNTQSNLHDNIIKVHQIKSKQHPEKQKVKQELKELTKQESLDPNYSESQEANYISDHSELSSGPQYEEFSDDLFECSDDLYDEEENEYEENSEEHNQEREQCITNENNFSEKVINEQNKLNSQISEQENEQIITQKVNQQLSDTNRQNVKQQNKQIQQQQEKIIIENELKTDSQINNYTHIQENDQLDPHMLPSNDELLDQLDKIEQKQKLQIQLLNKQKQPNKQIYKDKNQQMQQYQQQITNLKKQVSKLKQNSQINQVSFQQQRQKIIKLKNIIVCNQISIKMQQEDIFSQQQKQKTREKLLFQQLITVKDSTQIKSAMLNADMLQKNTFMNSVIQQIAQLSYLLKSQAMSLLPLQKLNQLDIKLQELNFKFFTLKRFNIIQKKQIKSFIQFINQINNANNPEIFKQYDSHVLMSLIFDQKQKLETTLKTDVEINQQQLDINLQQIHNSDTSIAQLQRLTTSDPKIQSLESDISNMRVSQDRQQSYKQSNESMNFQNKENYLEFSDDFQQKQNQNNQQFQQEQQPKDYEHMFLRSVDVDVEIKNESQLQKLQKQNYVSDFRSSRNSKSKVQLQINTRKSFVPELIDQQESENQTDLILEIEQNMQTNNKNEPNTVEKLQQIVSDLQDVVIKQKNQQNNQQQNVNIEQKQELIKQSQIEDLLIQQISSLLTKQNELTQQNNEKKQQNKLQIMDLINEEDDPFYDQTTMQIQSKQQNTQDSEMQTDHVENIQNVSLSVTESDNQTSIKPISTVDTLTSPTKLQSHNASKSSFLPVSLDIKNSLEIINRDQDIICYHEEKDNKELEKLKLVQQQSKKKIIDLNQQINILNLNVLDQKRLITQLQNQLNIEKDQITQCLMFTETPILEKQDPRYIANINIRSKYGWRKQE